MPDSQTATPQVTPCTQRTAPSSQPPRHMTGVNVGVYRWLVDIVGITNNEMARATGMSESYAAQVGSGTRVRVNVDFVNRAAIYIAARMSEPVVITRALLTKEQ